LVKHFSKIIVSLAQYIIYVRSEIQTSATKKKEKHFPMIVYFVMQTIQSTRGFAFLQHQSSMKTIIVTINPLNKVYVYWFKCITCVHFKTCLRVLLRRSSWPFFTTHSHSHSNDGEPFTPLPVLGRSRTCALEAIYLLHLIHIS